MKGDSEAEGNRDVEFEECNNSVFNFPTQLILVTNILHLDVYPVRELAGFVFFVRACTLTCDCHMLG